MGKPKKLPVQNENAKKRIAGNPYSSDSMKIIWAFDRLDNDGEFAFNLDREDFNHEEVLRKITLYGNMTWADVKSQTHDKHGKSKHHLLNVSGISTSGMSRVKLKLEEQEYDQIFSFALQNKLRLIGLRNNEVFHVIWFDPGHKFYPSTK